MNTGASCDCQNGMFIASFLSNYIFLMSNPLCFAFPLKTMKNIPSICNLLNKMGFYFVRRREGGSWLCKGSLVEKQTLALATNNDEMPAWKRKVLENLESLFNIYDPCFLSSTKQSKFTVIIHVNILLYLYKCI